MKTVAIYPGRFMPFHKGHKAVYDRLVNQFGQDNVYIGTSNKQAPITSPFSFDQKEKMMTTLGIPQDKIVQVSNPYIATEITKQFDKENTAVVFAVSSKDAERFTFKPKKDGSPSYMQPYNKDKLKPMITSGYILVVPSIKFEVGGEDVSSATEIRQMYIDGDDIVRNSIIKDLYNKPSNELKQLFDKQLAITEWALKLINNSSKIVTESINAKLQKSITKIRFLESKIKHSENKRIK